MNRSPAAPGLSKDQERLGLGAYPKGSQDPNNRILWPECYNMIAIWALNPIIRVLGVLGPLTLNPKSLKPLNPKHYDLGPWTLGVRV